VLKGEFRSLPVAGIKCGPRRETAASALALDTDAGGIKPEPAGISVQPDKRRVDVLQRRRVRRFRREAIIHGIDRAFQQGKTVWQRLPGHKSAWISHIDEQPGHRVPPKGRGPSMVDLPASFSAPSNVLTQPGTCGVYVIIRFITKVTRDKKLFVICHAISPPNETAFEGHAMSPTEAMKNIKAALQGAARNGYIAELHVQIIKYADVLQNVSGKEFCEEVGIGRSFGTEFAKMKKIAPRLRNAGLDPNRIKP
jgi:hypothetical protein